MPTAPTATRSVKTAELIGTALDWAVAMCLEMDIEIRPAGSCGRPLYVLAAEKGRTPWTFYPSTQWVESGPIIEREKISTEAVGGDERPEWWANAYLDPTIWRGPTPLIAAMRCFVASKLGETVDIPEELLT
jgi:hypothetical protein